MDNTQNIFEACKKGDLGQVKGFIKQEVNIEDKYGYTPLILASRYGHIEVVKFLVDQGADLEAKDNCGCTPLVWASSYEVVKFLLESGAYLEAKNNDGCNPLIIASINGHKEVVKILVEKGANLEAKDRDGYTPLMVASYYGYIEIVKFLVEKGADIEAKNFKGKLFHELISLKNHREEIELFLKDIEERKRMIKPCKKRYPSGV